MLRKRDVHGERSLCFEDKHAIPTEIMTNRKKCLHDPAVKQVESVSGTKSTREETSVDKLAANLGSAQLDKRKTVVETKNSAKDPIVPMPDIEERRIGSHNRGRYFRSKPLTLEDQQHLYAFTRPKVSKDILVEVKGHTKKQAVFSGEYFDGTCTTFSRTSVAFYPAPNFMIL
ncbi:hypothetical protein BGZ99_009815 [Dissophora globulifera]|uniref:Uncharacterized protein n=1 Tax=Dissophora globulifera TaxID=979702 RepID=A0A9P6UMZ2_9FUNG|nr:hypothetical protein BGZ99_009815 [Dissophora globulifera]